jgi:hypothetical protein
MFRTLIFTVLVAVSQMAYALEYVQEITEQEIQAEVSAFMPIERTKYFVTITISNPIIDLLKETDEISLLANIEANAPGIIKGRGKIMINGTLDYDAIKGEFNLKNPTIVSLTIDDVAEEFMPEIKKIAQMTLSKAMMVYPVYRFKDTNIKEQLAKSVLKSVKVKNETLFITLEM